MNFFDILSLYNNNLLLLEPEWNTTPTPRLANRYYRTREIFRRKYGNTITVDFLGAVCLLSYLEL